MGTPPPTYERDYEWGIISIKAQLEDFELVLSLSLLDFSLSLFPFLAFSLLRAAACLLLSTKACVRSLCKLYWPCVAYVVDGTHHHASQCVRS
jgi:hypothetical protein